MRLAPLAVVFALGCSSVAFAQAPPNANEPGRATLASTMLGAGQKLSVSSPAFKEGADIPFANTQYQGNVFPGLAWTAGPAATKTYAIVMQDGDVMSKGAALVHWSLVNVPATVLSLPGAMNAPPPGATNGPNMKGASQPYLGPRTPAGPKHRYHFQVFALDKTLPYAADYAALTAAMKGDVLASGQLIGLGQIDPTAPPPPGASTNTATTAPIPQTPPPGPDAH